MLHYKVWSTNMSKNHNWSAHLADSGQIIQICISNKLSRILMLYFVGVNTLCQV